MATGSSYTAAEVAFMLREPVKTVKRALDDGPVTSTLVPREGGAMRAVDRTDLVYLLAMRGLRDELTPKARRAFYDALKRQGADESGYVDVGRLRIAVGDVEREVSLRERELEALAEAVAFGRSGEPLIRGTDIEVHRIAALIDGGMTIEEVMVDYPSLDPEQIEGACAYAKAHPKTGRPYPATTFKRMTAKSGIAALDEVLGPP